ncbi:MAG: protease pro-enzyme activation domain-containing protein [Terracidiphilus sp.]
MKPRPGVFAVAVLAIATIAANGQPSTAIEGQQGPGSPVSLVTLIGHTPPQVLDGTAIRIGHYDPEQKLRLAVVLAVPYPVEEQQFLEDIQNKQSPLFHQFLSAEEWNARFGPSAENEQAVVDWAQSQGLTVTHRYNNRLVVDLEAQAGGIEKALNLTINHYQLPAENGLEARTVYSNDRDPSLPENLTGVVDAVLGLNSINVARPGGGGRLVPRPDYVPGPVVQELDSLQIDAIAEDRTAIANGAGNTPEVKQPKSNKTSPTYYWSSKAYDYQALMNQGHCCNPLKNSSGHSPRESSIAIAAFGDVSLADVGSFQQVFSYLALNVDKVAIDGRYTCNNTPIPDGSCVEVTMDTEWSLAMANSEGAASDTARVVVYEGSNYTNGIIMDVYTQMADDAHARTMSTSWGWKENAAFSNKQGDTFNATMHSVDKVFSSMVGQGWTLLAASGDNGAYAGCQDQLAVQFPSSDPNVVGVGGTILGEVGNADYEIAWAGFPFPQSCLHNQGGSTGGFSEYFTPAPSYQSGMGFGSRAVPDMALDAGAVHDVYYDGGWVYSGGTSVSTPMLAGFFAQENAYLLSIGNKCGPMGKSACAPVGNANYPLYEEGRKKNAARSPFYDMLVNCNSNDITSEYPGLGDYCAHPGFDEVTGWGSANMLQLAWALNSEITPANGIPNIVWSGPATHKWYNSNQTVSWTIRDYVPPGSAPGTGIAGSTAGWASIPDDPSSEPHGGSGNSFYDGPQFPNESKGCLAFKATSSCSGGVSQGCHTAHARGWNNQGWSTAGNSSFPETYGPLCYDTVAPTIEVSNNPASPPASGWYTQPVTVTLKASDPGGSKASGVWKVFYSINDDQCARATYGDCIEYKSPFAISAPGIQTITAFSRDNAGNSSGVKTDVIKIDTGGPTISIGSTPLTPASGWFNGSVTVSLSATDPSGIADIFYAIDKPGCGTKDVRQCSIYSVPIVLSSQGIETVNAFSKDNAGIYSSLASVSIKIDTTPPVTTAALSGTEVSNQYQSAVGVVLAATDNLSGVKATYYSVDGGAAVTYSGPFSISIVGSHTLNYWSVDVAGNTETANSQPLIIDSPTSAMLTASPNPSVPGQSVTLTATIASMLTGTPVGTVSFFNGATLLGTGTLTNGVATFATTALPLGSDTLQATYPGAPYYLAAGPATYAQTVEQAPTATATAPAVTFNPAPIGISAASAQTLTASFTISNFKGSFTPTATLHYGHDYTLGAINCTGSSPETCTVAVSFLPTLPGARKDAVQLMAGSTILATALLGGTGQGPMALIQPGMVTSPVSGAPYYIYQSVVDENGTVYFLSDNSNAVYSLAKGSNSPSTVPVTGLSSPHGIDIDGAGTLYIAQNNYGTNIVTYNTVTGVQGAIPVIPPAPYKPCSTAEYLYAVAVDDAGNLFTVDFECDQIFELAADGTYTTNAIDPTMIGPSNIAVDAADNVFIGGYDINELTAGGVQTQINTIGASEGLLADAADTLYATRYTGTGGVAELLQSNYSASAFALDPTSGPLGEGLGSDGTLYVGNYSDLDKVDRSQGAIAFGEQTAGFESTAQNVSLYNGGNEPLTVSNIAISGPPFNLLPGGTNNCTVGLMIAPGASCEVALTITPPHAGTYSGTVTFTSNSVNTASTVQTVAMTAFVYGVYIVPSPTALTFANQTTGITSAASMVMLTNEGDLYAAGIETPTSSNPAFTPTLGTCTVSIAVGSSCQLNVTFSPSLAQLYSGTITVPAYSGGGGTTPSATFTVSGMGVAPSASAQPASSLRGPR